MPAPTAARSSRACPSAARRRPPTSRSIPSGSGPARTNSGAIGMAETYQSALIVGAGSGLSASLARAFAKAGMRVGLAARAVDKLAGLAKDTGAKTYACDASQRAEVDKLFAALDGNGAPDVVVYNASYRTRG